MQTTMTDIEYAKEMIVHHQMAVDMSRKLLSGSPRPKMKAFAEKVIEAQTKEIEWLKEWSEDGRLKEWSEDGSEFDDAFEERFSRKHR
jgi:uncharacterized protein (DUF305 family)